MTNTSRNLDKQFQEVLSIFDDVLRQHGQPPLFDNPIFRPDLSLQTDFVSCFRTNTQKDTIGISFFIGGSGVEFHIDRTGEMPDWSYEMIKQNEDKFRQDLTDIFTSDIEAEHKGTKTVLRFLDTSGRQKRQFTFHRGIGLNFLCKSEFKLYKPTFHR